MLACMQAELELRSQELMMEEGGYDYMDEDRCVLSRALGCLLARSTQV